MVRLVSLFCDVLKCVNDQTGSTVQRQRRELQLLMAELRDREKELNIMSASARKHLLAWDHDHQRMLALEQRCAHLNGEDVDALTQFLFRQLDFGMLVCDFFFGV